MRSLIALLLAALLPVAVRAEDPPKKDGEDKKVEELEKRLQKLEKEQALDRVKFSGDFRFEEWCGVCFSPDGRWLFANCYTPGFTAAITGPWENGPL